MLIIACGALAHEITALRRASRWDQLDVRCLPAELHNRPEKIPAAVRALIRSSRDHYRSIFVAYGDCGTGGLLDDVLREEGVERIPGAHCYEFFATAPVFAALADSEWIVGDLGCGTGQVSAALALFVGRVIAVDSSAAMLQAAKRRLAGFDNIDLRRGELEALPIDDDRLDVGAMMLVLHHVPEPQRAVLDVARVLKPGGRIIIGDMLPHDRESYRQQMGHVWLGFSEDHVKRMLTDAGFGRIRIVPVTPDARAKGPGLFVATARKPI